MKLRTWVKMGLKLLIIFPVLFLLVNSGSNMEIVKTEVLEFNENLGMSANAIKNEEEKPIEPDTLKYTSKASYSGYLTGYSADCPLCGGKLACASKYNVYKNGVVTYPDKEYGNVRIVASSKNLSCGSIIELTNTKAGSGTVYAIVLDRGVSKNNLDLLVESEKYASQYIGRTNISYNVLRFGW